MTSIKYISLALLMLFATGCASMGLARHSDVETQRALDVAMALKFEDVPIPTGFHVIPNETFTFQNEVLRVGILKYSGRVGADQVVNFYKDQMPLYNWNLINIVEYGRAVINFEREDQTCIVTVEPYTTKTVLTIAIAPRSSRR